MTPIGADEDLIKLRVVVADGSSRFVNEVYVGHADLAEAVARLESFKMAVHGGLLDLRFGEFGCEWAGGALHARFHFPKPGRLYLTCEQESDFVELGHKTVASRATIHFRSEPALLDRFIVALRSLATTHEGEAHLEAVWPFP
jgi:hypothetical protein